MTLTRIALFLALLSAVLWCFACGGSDSSPGRVDPGKIPMATLPATLPEPIIVEGTPQSPGPPGETYVVQPGDSLYAIAERLGVTVEELIELNDLADPTKLEVGQVLKIPGANPTAATPAATASKPTVKPTAESTAATATPRPRNTPGAGSTTYTVQSGDNANDIALRFGVTVQELAEANNMTVDNLRSLQVGDVLIIPTPSTTPAPVPTEEPTATPAETATPEG